MGIFEKSIPKYIVDPINQQVVVHPEDVYVDDIFDPIFNARVKDAMRQKYGDGLYGVVGGYEELWKNTWTGREGILGPGMGLLSTFGRSMEKADDIVLGALTEGIKALSFQGATNPIENIFVNDHDYTGRGLLASVANIGRPLVGGTTVDESDFGGAWTVPALGIELGTDVGILGGTLSRNLAPNASKLTPKQLFENLGKSDLKTSVGTVGQLMSDYDDLMTKIALDISAPGLRPATKKLMNRVAELVKHQSAAPYVNVTKQRPAKDGPDDSLLEPLVRMFVNLDDTLKNIPMPAAEEFAAADRLPSEVVSEVTSNSALNNLRHIITVSDNAAKFKNKALRPKNKPDIWEDTDKAFAKRNEGIAEAIQEFVKRTQENNIDLGDLSIDRFQGLDTDDLDEIYEILRHEFLSDFDDPAFRTTTTLEDIERKFFTPEELEYRKYRDAANPNKTDSNPDLRPTRESYDIWYEELRPDIVASEREASKRMQEYLWNSIYPLDYNALDERSVYALAKHAELTTDEEDVLNTLRSLSDDAKPEFREQHIKQFKAIRDKISVSPQAIESVKRTPFKPKKMFLTDKEREVIQTYQAAPRGWADITKMHVTADTVLPKDVVLFKYKDVFASIAAKQKYAEEFGTSAVPKSKIPTSLNKTYIPEFIDTLSNRESFENALFTGEWTSNDAFNSSVDAVLYGPKYKTNSKVNLYNNIYTLSPSKYSRLEAAGVPGIRAVRRSLKKVLPVTDAEALDKLLDSDEMTAALNAVLPPTDRGWYNNAVANFKDFDSDQQIERVDKFKKLLKDAVFPDAKQSISEYSKAVEDLVDYVDWYYVSTAKGTPARNLLEMVPAEAELLDDLYRRLDDIRQHYVQPINNVPRRSLDFTGRRSELYFQNEADDFGIDADYGNYEAWIQAMFSKVAPYIDSEEKLKYFYEPFKPYMELKLKRNGKELYNPSVVKSAPFGKISMKDVRDVAYDQSKNSVKRYITEVLPLYEKYVSLGGNLFGKKEFIPKGFSKDDFEKLKVYFGKHGAAPDANADDFNELNRLFFPGYWKDVEKKGKFKAKRPISEEGVSDNYYDVGKVLGSNVLSPTQLEHFVLTHDQMVKSSAHAKSFGNKTDNISKEIAAVSAQLRRSLPDIGIKDEHALDELLNKIHANNLDDLRSKFNSLSAADKRRIHAYAILYESAMAKVPYRVISRSRQLVSADSGYQMLYSTVAHGLKGTDGARAVKKMSPRTAGRIRQLLNTELEWHFAKGNATLDANKYTSDTALLLESLNPTVNDYIYRDTVLSEISPEFTVPRMNEFLHKFRQATALDGSASATLRKREHALAEYYARQGKRHRMANTNVYDARNAICKEYFGKPYRKYQSAIDEWISEYFEAEALDVARRKAVEDATRELGSRNAYSVANVKYVKDHLISRLSGQYRAAWKPSPERGLFYFDIQDGEQAAAMYVGETFEIRPGDFQRRLRSGKNYAQLMKLPENKRPMTSYLDYAKLTSPTEVDRAARWLANRHIQMEYMATPYRTLADTTVEILEKPKSFKLTSRNVAENIREVQEAVIKATPDEIANAAYEATSIQLAAVESALVELIGPYAVKYLKDGGDPEGLKDLLPKDEWDLYLKIAQANATPSLNSIREARATLRESRAANLLSRVSSAKRVYLEEKGGKISDFRRFVALRQQPYGDIVQGTDFWDELRHSGMLGAVYAKGSASADGVFDSLTKNANIINELVQHPIVKVVREDMPNGKEKIYLQFVKNKKGVVWINAAADKLEKAAFETVTFSPPKAWTAEDLAFMNSDTMREFSALMDEAQALAADQAKYLGFTFDTSSQYTKHAMRRNTDTALWFNDTFYKDFSSEDLDEFVNCISNLERYRKADHGAFGTTVNTRRFRGDVWMMDDGLNVRFNYDPYEMVTSALADGMFANLQFQSYVDLFINDNFKIKEWFHSIDDLKEVLYKTTEDGKASGNLRNLELCTMKLDANGKIIGLTKYDKLSDAGLQKALADENCILVPTNAVSHIDNLLKKDIRMSNKLWTFVNKHFTIPFKFGVLSNPGFLLGNMSDSYLKLVTTMCQKYGTTVKAEAARVAGCIQRAGEYKEDYGTAFEVWRKVSRDNGIKLSPEATIPDIVAMSPKYNEQFLKWLDGRLKKVVKDPTTGKLVPTGAMVPCNLPNNVKNAASTWVMLQTAQMNSSKLREFADIAGLSNTSEFEMPTNLWDRITQGKGKYDKHRPSTWGFFMNNPATSAMLNASTGWEDIIRTASILDDLEHGYTFEELGILSRAPKGTPSDVDFRVKLDEAKNTMYNAQFDYERGSNFMEGVGKAVPFPVFFLKNFAYWMELFAENPQYVDNAIDVQEGLWSNRDEENAKDTFAVEAKGRGAIPVGGESLPEWFKGYYKPAPLQSMFGAFNLLNDPIGNMQYRVNPLISSGIAAVNKAAPNELTTSLAPTEETKYRPYSTDMYERNVKASDPNFNPLEYAVHRANPYERALNSYLRVPHKIREGEAQLSDFAPSVFQPDF